MGRVKMCWVSIDMVRSHMNTHVEKQMTTLIWLHGHQPYKGPDYYNSLVMWFLFWKLFMLEAQVVAIRNFVLSLKFLGVS